MTFGKPTAPDLGALKPAEKLTREGRSDGEADVVDVPQADVNNTAQPADGVKHADKAATIVRVTEGA